MESPEQQVTRHKFESGTSRSSLDQPSNARGSLVETIKGLGNRELLVKSKICDFSMENYFIPSDK
jgi:hypothetical protein